MYGQTQHHGTGFFRIIQILGAFFFFIGTLHAQSFTNVASTTGVEEDATNSSYAVSWADYDNDGDQDLYVVNFYLSDRANHLFRNNGDGTFTQVTTGAEDEGDGVSGVWADYDNDGDIDLYVANAGPSGNNRLFKNDGAGNFTDVAVAAGVNNTGAGYTAVWGDYDNDGHVDLYLAIDLAADRLFHNKGDGTFEDATTSPLGATGRNWGANWGDYDNDGDIDLYVADETGANHLYRNDGGGTFVDVASTANVAAGSGSGRSPDWVDYDNDGDLDLYQTSSGANLLYENNNDGTFTNVAGTANVAGSDASVNSAWADYDNDGDLDIYVTNGSTTANRLYKNNNDGTFTEVGATEGVNDTQSSTTSAWADYDNDGDVDLYVGNINNGINRLYRNDTTGNRWLSVSLTGSLSNTSAIGAQVTAVAGTLRQRQDVSGGSGYGAQSSLPLEFGLASVLTLDSLIVKWPNGLETIQTAISTNQALSITESVDISIANTVASSDTVAVPIQIEQTVGANILSTELFIAFDSSIATFVTTDITGTLTQSGWLVADNIKPGVGNIDTLKISMATASSALAGPGTLIYLKFDISGAPPASSTNLDLAHVRFNTGSPPARIVNGALSSSGTDALVSALPDTIFPTQSVTITVTDLDANTFNGSIDSVLIEAFATVYADTQNVWLFETGLTTGTFTQTLPTEYNTSGTVGDGILSVVAGDSIGFNYTDALTVSGPPANLQTFVQVIGGVDGTVNTSPDTITPGKVVSLSVTDTDENVNASTIDSILVQTFTTTQADSENVWLMETGVNTAIFTGTINTTFDSSTTINDGILSVALSDSVALSYTDILTAVGSTLIRTDYTTVIPFDNGLVEISYVLQASDGRNSVRDTARVRIIDTDLDLLVGTPDQVSLTVTNRVSSESETLTLTETGNSTGIFQLRVPTVQGISGTNNDNIFTIASGDTLSATYIDVTNATGTSDTLQALSYVVNLIGDSDLNGQVQAFDAAYILGLTVGTYTATFIDSLVSDVDGDNDILAFDATLVNQYMVDIIDRFPVQTDSATSPPTDIKNHPFLKPSMQPLIAFGAIQIQDDGTYRIPIQVPNHSELVSGTFQIGFDPGMEITNITLDSSHPTYILAHHTNSDHIRIALSAAQASKDGSNDLVWLHFQLAKNIIPNFKFDRVWINGLYVPSVPEHITLEQAPSLPITYALHPNSPNPFNPETTIRYDIPSASTVNLSVYSITGQRIRTLVSEYQEAGFYQVVWNGKNDRGRAVGSGVYLLHIQADTFLRVQKMLMLK